MGILPKPKERKQGKRIVKRKTNRTMSKAEERALEAYPPLRCYNDFQMVEEDINKPLREIYQEGYHQAEKDLELTWEDVKEICVQSVLVEVDLGGLVSDERHYTEVLKRFKDYKERKKK